jgi:hypothetical protein
LASDSNGDQAGMYRVPTSLTNLLGYITNMASLAGTSGTDGTSHDDAYDAMVGVDDMLMLLGNWTQ